MMFKRNIFAFCFLLTIAVVSSLPADGKPDPKKPEEKKSEEKKPEEKKPEEKKDSIRNRIAGTLEALTQVKNFGEIKEPIMDVAKNVLKLGEEELTLMKIITEILVDDTNRVFLQNLIFKIYSGLPAKPDDKFTIEKQGDKLVVTKKTKETLLIQN